MMLMRSLVAVHFEPLALALHSGLTPQVPQLTQLQNVSGHSYYTIPIIIVKAAGLDAGHITPSRAHATVSAPSSGQRLCYLWTLWSYSVSLILEALHGDSSRAMNKNKRALPP